MMKLLRAALAVHVGRLLCAERTVLRRQILIDVPLFYGCSPAAPVFNNLWLSMPALPGQ